MTFPGSMASLGGLSPDLAPDGPHPERASFADVLLLERLRGAIARINPTVPAEAGAR